MHNDNLELKLEIERQEFLKGGSAPVRYLLRKFDEAAGQVKDSMPTMPIEQIPRAQATYLVLTQEVPRIIHNLINAGLAKDKQISLQEFMQEKSGGPT